MKQSKSNSNAPARWLPFALAASLLAASAALAVEGVVDESKMLMAPIVVESAKSATLPDVMTKLSDERLIYVGETHTAFADHLLQLEVLRHMAAQPAGLGIGVEWFQRRFQPVLDAYLAGEIDEAEMLRRAEYYERWQYDYRLYRPIMRFARDNAIPIVALNASRELTNEIRRVGIDELADGLRADLPESYDFSDTKYESTLRKIFELHAGEDSAFRRFLEVQLTWDESMAEGVARFLAAGSEHRILVLAGRGHIAGRGGIPNRVTRRTGLRGVSIARYSPSDELFNDADYLVLASDRTLPFAGLMQVMLDERDDGMFVVGFADGSPAEEAGVQKGDKIVSINGAAIKHFADIKVALLDQQPDNEIELSVVRSGLLGKQKLIELSFRLAGQGSALPH